METVIPIQVQLMVWGLIVSGITWLFVRQFQHEKRIAIAETTFESSNEEIKRMISELQVDTEKNFDKINSRMDMFFSSEIQLLKDIVKDMKPKGK